MAAKKAGSGKVETNRALVKQVLGTTHRVWLAGLGTVAWARAESSKVFGTLVKEGEKVQAETRETLKESAEQTRQTVVKTKGEVGKRLNRLEGMVQRRVESVLHRIGVPSAHDVRELSQRVNRLSKSMTALAPEK